MSAKNQSSFRVVVGCKVCKDAGKPESEYSTHFVKDREGRVTCPTLLSLQCRYCQKSGHTVSHCPTLTARNKTEEKAKRVAEFANKKEVSKSKITDKPKTKFGFDMLADEEEESFEVEIKPVFKQVHREEFPALVQIESNATTGGAAAMSYASMASKTIEDYENEQFEKKIRENALKNIKIVAPTQKKAPLKVSEMNWAMEDSDSDSDDDW